MQLFTTTFPESALIATALLVGSDPLYVFTTCIPVIEMFARLYPSITAPPSTLAINL